MDQTPDPGSSPGAHLSEPGFTAAEAPRLMCKWDGRGRMTVLIQLAKDWACSPSLREAMIVDPPKRRRWHHKFTPWKRDLARVAAVVHVLCDRDGHPVPDWVWQHRSARAIHLDSRPGASREVVGFELSLGG